MQWHRSDGGSIAAMPDREEPAEVRRLREEAARKANWKRWGPYLSDRQWGTVREDYSVDGDCWSYFPHDHARLRAYRWGEDGLLGWCDRRCRLCFGIALWNGKDAFLKERLFGLTNPQGNHGEDVKELYYHLDATPTGSYAKALYKYPQAAFPYEQLVEENARRGTEQPEYEIEDTGVFDDGRYFDVQVEYAKASANDCLMRITITNRGPDSAELTVLPQLWFRNGWSWGATHDGCFPKPRMASDLRGAGFQPASGSEDRLEACPTQIRAVHRSEHYSLGEFVWSVEQADELIFTDNESNAASLGWGEGPRFSKDAFHRYICDGEEGAVDPDRVGTKAAAVFRLKLDAGESRVIRCRLAAEDEASERPFEDFDAVFAARIAEADAFYASIEPPCLTDAERPVWRQSYAGLLWTKQFYHYVVDRWIDGDPAMPAPPPEREKHARNRHWKHLFNYDVLSMPDKWEYPWYATWDLAFHMLPMARIDPAFAKKQLVLLLREWYMRADGSIPAYEFNFGDVNPPVHAWAVWRVYKMTGARGERDAKFLAACFHKLLLNFTWWVNKKDESGRHVFGGGFLGMDNVGVFDRSHPPADGQRLEQADGTAWMAFYCVTMLSIALELAEHDASYEGIASKFFEHFAAITHAMNSLGGTGLWDERDGFYYDQLFDESSKTTRPLRVRSLVGLVPLLACGVLERDAVDRLPSFKRRMNWFLENQSDLAQSVTRGDGRYLLSVAPLDRLKRVLGYLFDKGEFLSDFGVRSLSKYHAAHPFALDGSDAPPVAYTPGESLTNLFGGNSNWRGPIWFPLNYLLVEALERYHHFLGDGLTVTVDGDARNLRQAAAEVQQRLTRPFLPAADGRRPCFGDGVLARLHACENFANLLLFHEFFHAETGRGCGASHQTGWTALVGQCIENACRSRARSGDGGRVHGVRLTSATVE